jgi:hypothetical protein
MASKTEKTSGQTTCIVDVSPDIVDAGAEMSLRGEVSCSPACDLRGHTLLVKDELGADACRVELNEFDGVTNRTREFVLKAPVKPGQYTWLALSPAVVKEGVSYAQSSTPISITVKPHSMHVVAWDAPSAVVVGERFKMKVGIKCSNECDLANRNFGIYDQEGTQIASSTLNGERWPGTAGLYFTAVELEAPAREGLYTWTVRVPASGAGLPHAEGGVSFGVRVVSHPDYVVTVEAVDKDSQTPLSLARVVMHPYNAVTDERGVAELRVAKGTYKIFVTQTNYLTFGQPVEVTADMKARVELELEPIPERN